ncbi:MAG: DUF1015 domain-containing protein [Clostridia bacterium]|nr:DUF1015 domain-containing protein [Clostridia bacterium]
MPVIKPFRALKPQPHLADKVAALPYDVMDTAEAREMAKGNPYSFLHVDKAEIDLEPGIDLYDPRVYQQARDNLNKMIATGTFIQDKQQNYYIYRQIMKDHVQTGLVATVSVDDYLNNSVKKHEYTRQEKEQDRIKHVDCCNAQTGPIFLTYRARQEIDAIIDSCVATHSPLYDFVAEDGVSHIAWVIDDSNIIQELTAAFTRLDSLYIADGHHRCAAAVKVAQQRRQANPNYSGLEEFNYFLAVIFPDNQLQIMDYNRVVKDLNGLSTAEFLDKIATKFVVEMCPDNCPCRPEQKNKFGMYLQGQWYRLNARPETLAGLDLVAGLDVSILQDNILAPILGIADPRTDARIDFVGGIRGLAELERRVNEGMAVAFALYPTTIHEVMTIADAGQVMPPKSTWFEPKLRSGLFIHLLD